MTTRILINRISLAVIIALAFLIAMFFVLDRRIEQVFSATTVKYVNDATGYTVPFTFFTATTTNATSTNNSIDDGDFNIRGAKNVVFYFSRGGATGPNTGSSKFNIQVTPDGTNWYDYNTLGQNLATSSEPTIVPSATISAATSTTLVYMERLGFFAVRCIVVETTDGDHTCKAEAEF